jgi:hypothetical protein
MGIDAKGSVAFALANRGAPLAPMVCAATVMESNPLTLRPVAGALPMGGSSGGAIVDRDGVVVGLHTGAGLSPERAAATYWFEGVSVESFAERLGPSARSANQR